MPVWSWGKILPGTRFLLMAETAGCLRAVSRRGPAWIKFISFRLVRGLSRTELNIRWKWKFLFPARRRWRSSFPRRLLVMEGIFARAAKLRLEFLLIRPR